MSDTKALFAVLVSFASVLFGDIGLLALFSVLVWTGHSAHTKAQIRSAFFVCLALLAIFIVIVKLMGYVNDKGIDYSAWAYALLGGSAILVGCAGYVSLAWPWRYLPVPLAVWGVERIYLVYKGWAAFR